MSNAALLRDVRSLFGCGVVRDASDRELLERFLAPEGTEAEAAFSALIERHGPMVYYVCRQVLDQPHDAEDAFQATFLVLLRRAASVRKRESLASWLFGVALRVARRARYAGIARRFHERRASELAAARLSAGDGHSAALAALHEEIASLPERFREPIVLCHLEGLSTAAAARRLGCAPGTILSRLARGRARVRGRLFQRGVAVPAGMLVAFAVPQATAAGLPAALVSATASAVVRTGARGAALGATVSPRIAALIRAATRTWLLTRLTIAAGVLATATALVVVTISFVHPSHGAATSFASAAAPPGSAATPLQSGRQEGDRDKLTRDDLRLLQGTWYRISSELRKNVPMEAGGRPIPPDESALMLVIKDDGWYGVGPGGNLVQGHIIRLDPTRSPKVIDLYGIPPHEDPDGRPWIQGIYKLDGDILTLCLSFGCPDRPTEFATGPGPGCFWLDVYRRQRAPEAKPGPGRPQGGGPSAKGAGTTSPRPRLREQDKAVAQVDSSHALAYAPDGRTLVTTGFPGTINLWNPRENTKVGELKEDASIVRSVAFAPDGITLASVSDDGHVRLWDLPNRSLKNILPGLRESRKFATPTSIVFAPDSQSLAIAGWGEIRRETSRYIYEVRVLDVRTGQPRWSHLGQGGTPVSLAISPDGKVLACAGWNGVVLWNAQTGEPLRTLKPERGSLYSVAYTPDGRYILGGGIVGPPGPDGGPPAGLVTVWHFTTGRIVRTLEGQSRHVRALVVAPDGKTVASGSWGPLRRFGREQRVVSEVRLWDIATGKLLWVFEGELGEVAGLAFAPDGRTLVYCDHEAVGVIDVATGKLVCTLARTTRRPRP
jgi:RNA polymerase sigma-70 factor (ECF subfamily)